jgi:hypothetical protein
VGGCIGFEVICRSDVDNRQNVKEAIVSPTLDSKEQNSTTNTNTPYFEGVYLEEQKDFLVDESD